MSVTEHLKGTIVTNADTIELGSGPQAPNHKTIHGGILRFATETLEVSDNASVGSVYRFARIPSSAVVVYITVKADTLTAGSCDIGLYRTAEFGGAVIDADCYAAELSIAGIAGTTNVNQSFEARDFGNNRKKAWEDAGLTADPGQPFDIALTTDTATITDPGTLMVQVLWMEGQ